jgi:hypothetical protein
MKDMTPYQKMAESIGFGDSKIMPKMFAAIADEDEAKLILAASPPATLEELGEKTGLPITISVFRLSISQPGIAFPYLIRNLGLAFS